MSEGNFIDYYDLLQLSPNADTDTIERVFRHFAKKLHPDNKESGDADRFRRIVETHRTLSSPEIRAEYDVKYRDYWNRKRKVASEARNGVASEAQKDGYLSPRAKSSCVYRMKKIPSYLDNPAITVPGKHAPAGWTFPAGQGIPLWPFRG